MEVKTCQLCNSHNLNLIIDLGLHPLADTFLTKDQLNEKDPLYPLQVFMCQDCGYASLGYIVPAEKRYQATDYSYTSSNTPVAIKHFEELAVQAIKKNKINKEDIVVDIGSNVGTLLSAFKKQIGCKVVGVEPSSNIAKIAEEDDILTIQNFFNGDTVNKIIKQHGKAKAILATNVFNHITDLDMFMNNIQHLLTEDGQFIFETPYLLPLVKNVSFDTIYLEHVSYFSVKPFEKFFKKHSFFISHLEENDYMGGSIRVYLSKQKSNQSIIEEYISKEEDARIYEKETYNLFMKKVKKLKTDLLNELNEVKQKGERVIGIGAATKGNTLLNYCKIDNTVLDFVTDSSPLKIGKYTPGMHIPIKADEDITSDIHYALILPWNITPFLTEKLKPLNLKFLIPQIDNKINI